MSITISTADAAVAVRTHPEDPVAISDGWSRFGPLRRGAAAGAVAVLFTDLANPTSNKIYQAIGYRPVADRVSISFG